MGCAKAYRMAVLLISSEPNELTGFHHQTSDHDPKSEANFNGGRHRVSPIIAFLESDVVEARAHLTSGSKADINS
jgi:hypothetical protein